MSHEHHKILFGEDKPNILHFRPRGRHADIRNPYTGIPPHWYDNWVWPTLEDLRMTIEAPHLDYDRDGLMRTIGAMR